MAGHRQKTDLLLGDNYDSRDRYDDNQDVSGPSKNSGNSSGSYSNDEYPSKGNGTPTNDTYSNDDHYNYGNITSKGGSSYQNEEPINDPPYDDYNHSDRETPASHKGSQSDSMYPNNDNNDTHGSEPISKGGGNQTENNYTAAEENNTLENDRPNSGHAPASHVPNHFETCTSFKRNYDEFRETLVSNSSNLRRAMISRSDPSHIGRVIDRTTDLRDIHHDYLTAGARSGDRICLATEIIRDERRYVEFIRFTAPNMHTFDDEPVIANTADIQRQELTQLHRDFTGFTNDVISESQRTLAGRDSHDTTLANAIGVYCNNMIRLSRRERTMIPAEVSRSFASPIVNNVQRDWSRLTNNNSAPALQGQDDLVIRRYRAWARAVLLEHGNTTDEATINNYVNTFNGYRNY
ncbi:hypothetical protein N7U66_08285 [Lacinutrix neustonica]|uniref:Uncharacterized protein n=1 Tax=Lacinutrix neustonica TaxID=2980107 RepID=A0A9E8MYY9_9FLAO|nr:hypothetical protein [Lacinutrix neustonica]WAC03474.1 hypothetical protein N7U66_08285 [Lacinutrix neustonica]